MIGRAGRTLLDAASSPARVILLGSYTGGDTRDGSGLDLIVIERATIVLPSTITLKAK